MAQPKSSKQKRAAQNRASRQALAARRDNANAVAGGSTGGSGSKGRSGGFFSRIFNPKPPAKAAGGSPTGGTAAGGAGGARSAAAARAAALPPGHRAALSAVFASIAAVVMCATAIRLGVDGSGEVYTRDSLAVDWSLTAAEAHVAEPDASAKELVASIEEWTPNREQKPALIALWPTSISVILPVLAAALGFRAVRNRLGSKKVNRMVLLMVLGAFVTVGLMTIFLPAVIALGVAGFQVRKWETQNAVAVGDPSTGEVIEADVVDAEVVEGDSDPTDTRDA